MNLKEQAALRALDYVQSGMRLGLGTGSTTAIFVDLLGERLQTGRLQDICGVPTSERTAEQARRLGIPLVSLADFPSLDLAVDGADEVDPDLNLIKGLGKALLREKVVEVHARRFVVIADESKRVSRLGQGPLPVEIVPFEAEAHVRWLASLGCRAEPHGIADPNQLNRILNDRPGIVEHGLFIDMAQTVIIAGDQGIQVLEKAS